MLIHGVSPSDLLIGTMVPLQKDKRKAHQSFDNYRALTLGSIIDLLIGTMVPLQKDKRKAHQSFDNYRALTLGSIIDLLIGTMVPLQKDKRKAHQSFDNYRALTLGSIIDLLIGTMVPLQKDKRKAHQSFDNYRALTLGSIIDLLIGTMVPLQKDKRKAHQSFDNYRALTLGSIIDKLYDAIIIKQQTVVFNTSELQFGFKDGLSTTMCTFMVKETISYYVNNGSTVHVLLLDASKAFDRVNYFMLFKKSIDKGMCPLVVRLLLHTHQKLQVRLNDVMSNQFNVKNGVRQGGVMSSLLFGVYMDGLLEELKDFAIVLSNISVELQDMQMTLYYYVLLVLGCEK